MSHYSACVQETPVSMYNWLHTLSGTGHWHGWHW